MTGEYNVPPKMQCVVSHIERNVSMELQRKLIQLDLDMDIMNFIKVINYHDPLEQLV
jgi:hypothetical protein